MTSCWRHGELFEVMTNRLSSWRILTSWRTFWSHGERFGVMEVFDDVTHYLMPWHTLWRHDELLNVMMCSLLQGECCVVMTCLCCPDIYFHHFGNKILWKRVFDVIDIMINFLFMVDVWRHDKPFVIMPCFWWTFWRHGKFVDVMICFWHHDVNKFVDAMTCFWLHSITFWSMLHLLTSWRTFWCHGSFDDMTHFLCPDARHVFYIMMNLFVVMTYVRHYFGNKI